jgi:hypothetical protein
MTFTSVPEVIGLSRAAARVGCGTWDTHLDEIARNVHAARDTAAV